MAGCLVSLSMLSTRLTLLLMVATPMLMGVGTLMGSALRKLSRQCQEQVLALLPILPTCPIALCPAITPLPCHPPTPPISNLSVNFLDSLQVARATGVADEALGNVRTVRAFAMENREEE